MPTTNPSGGHGSALLADDHPDSLDVLKSCEDLLDHLQRTALLDGEELTRILDEVHFLLDDADRLIDADRSCDASDLLIGCAERITEVVAVRPDNVLELCGLPLWSTLISDHVLRLADAAGSAADPTVRRVLLAEVVRTIPVLPTGPVRAGLPTAARRAVLLYQADVRDAAELTDALARWEALGHQAAELAERLAEQWDGPAPEFLEVAERLDPSPAG